MPTHRRRVSCALAALLAAAALRAQAAPLDTKYLAPGFQSRPAGSSLVIVPADMELYSISAGGIAEPRADWTDAAQANFRAVLARRAGRLGERMRLLREQELDDMGELLALQRAVGEAIFIHHARPNFRLPTKEGRLDWSLGEAVKPLRERTGADYAMFTVVRDTYASAERKATIVAMALLGAVNFGGEQVGYAMLVDLATGRVVWFHDLYRMSGDLRDEALAAETLDTMLEGFPELE